MNYTKGEWKVEQGNGLELQEGLTHLFQIRAGETKEIIADIITDGNWQETDDNANANLISAAPDMYEALKDLLSWANIKDGSASVQLRDKCIKALSKAEGKQ